MYLKIDLKKKEKSNYTSLLLAERAEFGGVRQTILLVIVKEVVLVARVRGLLQTLQELLLLEASRSRYGRARGVAAACGQLASAHTVYTEISEITVGEFLLPLCAALFYELVVERTDGQPIGRGDELVIIVQKKLLPNISCPPNTIPKNEGLLRTFKKNNIILKVLLVINDYRFNLLI